DNVQLMRAAQLGTGDLGGRLRRIEPYIRHHVQYSIERAVYFRLGHELTDTHMGAETKTERGTRTTVNIKYVRILIDVFIAVGGADDAGDHRALWNLDATNLGVLCGLANLEGRYRFIANGLIDGLVDQSAIIAQPLQQLGILKQQRHQGAKRTRGSLPGGR